MGRSLPAETIGVIYRLFPIRIPPAVWMAACLFSWLLGPAPAYASMAECSPFSWASFRDRPEPLVTKVAATDLDAVNPYHYPEASLLQIPDLVGKDVQASLIASGVMQGVPYDAKIAFNLSMKGELELVSTGLSLVQHERILAHLRSRPVLEKLQAISSRMRIQYSNVQWNVLRQKWEIKQSLLKDVPIPFRSHLKTGFAELPSLSVTPYQPDALPPRAMVRNDLMAIECWQETNASCGIASLTKVLDSRNKSVTQSRILDVAIQMKGEEAFLEGKTAGLTLEELGQVIERTGKSTSAGPIAHELFPLPASDPVGIDLFRRQVKSVVNNRADVIVNYYSPGITRPGGGHYSVVAGYDPEKDMVLISEVNLTLNNSYWVSLPTLHEAMVERGYVVLPK